MSDRSKHLIPVVMTVLGIAVCCTVLTVPKEDMTLTGTAAERVKEAVLPAVLPEGGTVPVNTDLIEDLTVLPGIGENTATAWISEYQENGPFYYPEDLLSVRGIGEKKLESIIGMTDFSEKSE